MKDAFTLLKTDLAAHFVMLPQKINKNLYSFHQSCSVDGLEYLEVIGIIYRKKGCLCLPIWNRSTSFLELAPTSKSDQQSGDRGTVGFAWFSGGHFLRFQH